LVAIGRSQPIARVARMEAAQLTGLAADMDHTKSLVAAKIAERERAVAAMAAVRAKAREPAERGAELER
jgi:hypothetical protein